MGISKIETFETENSYFNIAFRKANISRLSDIIMTVEKSRKDFNSSPVENLIGTDYSL